MLPSIFRCDAKPTNLDGPGSHHRLHEKTDFLIKTFDPGILWDDYGIKHDIVVSSTFQSLQHLLASFVSLLHMDFHMQTFTNFLPLTSSTT